MLEPRPPAGPQRKSVAGPISNSTATASRKSFAVTQTYVRKNPGDGDVNANAMKGGLAKDTKSGTSGILVDNHIIEGQINLLSMIDTTKNMLCCKYTEDCSAIAAGFTDGVIRLFDCNEGTCAYTLVDEEIKSAPGPVTAIKHRPTGKSHPISNNLIATYVTGVVKCWKYLYENCLYTIREKRQTLGLSYHPRLPKFLTCGDDTKLHLYDEESQIQERSFFASENVKKMDGHTSRVFCSSFNPKSNHELVSGGWDNCVMFWDARVPYSVRHISGIHVCGESLDYARSGKELLTCAWQDNNRIQVWDCGTGKLINSVVPDTFPSKLYCGKYMGLSGYMVCGGSEPNLIRLVDLRTNLTEATIRNTQGGVYAVDVGPIRRKQKKNIVRAEILTKAIELSMLPKVAFVTGKRLMEIDFG